MMFVMSVVVFAIILAPPGDFVSDYVAQLEEDLRRSPVDIGIVTVTAEHAQEVVDVLTRGGVRAILNYTPTRVQHPEDVELKNINPVLFLQSMTYHLKRRAAEREDMRSA